MTVEWLAFQAETVESGLPDTGFGCILQVATGGGKIWLAGQPSIQQMMREGAQYSNLAWPPQYTLSRRLFMGVSMKDVQGQADHRGIAYDI